MNTIREALKVLDAKPLNEDYEHWAKKNYAKQFGEQSGKTAKEINKMLVELAKLDPTIDDNAKDLDILKGAEGPYMPWIIRALKKTSYEDMLQQAHEYKIQLSAFNDLKKRNRLPSDKKDIMQYKTLEDVMAMLQSLGGDASDEGGHSDFKQDISNIRECICRLCGLEDRDIPAEIKQPDDVLKFLGGNSKWEIWEAQNFWGTMILDRWGKGAGWCVGGMLGNNSGMEQVRVAKQYYPHYDANGTAHYVCFQQRDKNAVRPTNKYLITLGEGGSRPNNGSSGYQFNDASNSTQYLGGERVWGDAFQDAQMDALAEFLAANGLVETFKNTPYKDCACFLNVENKQRLDSGEPYRYVGGSIRDFLKTAIKRIQFAGPDGKDHIVSAEEHPEYLRCESIAEMVNMERLIGGEPYLYDGTTTFIPDKFKDLVKEVIIPDDYAKEVVWKGEKFIGIPFRAFRGCVNMTKCTFGENVVVLGGGCFKVADDGWTDIDVYTTHHRLKVSTPDLEWLKEHVHFTN